MNNDRDRSPDNRSSAAPAPELRAFGHLDCLAQRLSQIEAELASHGDAHDEALVGKARKLRKQLRDFEPAVTFIGQVKAGKTTLVNSLAGWPGLLPADVNPWTSVVTSLHLSPRTARDAKAAAFRFFSNDEWNNLVRQGGRVGEMASRAGAADELAKVRQQLDTMREKSRQRLGRRFEMLLGQEHSYDSLDPELIKRYVCMGDDFWEDDGRSKQYGRFADITKTADLWFENPDPAMRLCIRDTPGVNDTFMIREQITINALRGSRLCVMVLSAQQALSTIDLGLIRMISNLKSRDTIIFVNRIDELADPAREVPDIRKSITETLSKFGGPKDVELIFGSAFWAENAVADTLDLLGKGSAGALMQWADAQAPRTGEDGLSREAVWTLSGIPALGQAICERIEAGPAAQFLEQMDTAIANLQAGARTLDKMRGSEPGTDIEFVLSAEEVMARFQRIRERSVAALDQRLETACKAFDQRAEKSRLAFLDRATVALLKHLETHGEEAVWTYDPNGLRMLLRTAYRVLGSAAQKAAEEEAADCSREISDLLLCAVRHPGADLEFAPPPVPSPEAPVALAHTIALDLKGNWWTRFWRQRRGYQAYAKDFSDLIFQETLPIAKSLRSDSVEPYCRNLRDTLIGMIDDREQMLRAMLAAGKDGQSRQGAQSPAARNRRIIA